MQIVGINYSFVANLYAHEGEALGCKTVPVAKVIVNQTYVQVRTYQITHSKLLHLFHFMR